MRSGPAIVAGILPLVTGAQAQVQVRGFAGNLADVVLGKDTVAEYVVRSAEDTPSPFPPLVHDIFPAHCVCIEFAFCLMNRTKKRARSYLVPFS